MRRSIFALMAWLFACTPTPPQSEVPPAAKAPEAPKTYGPKEVPESLAALVQKGDSAILDLQKGLFSRLTNALANGEAVAAIAVCQVEAPKLKDEIAAKVGFDFGRTSHRPRNPKNAAPAWAKDHVAKGEGLKAAAALPVVIDLGDRIGLLRPIPTGPICVNCHGAKESMPAALGAALAERYPGDQAVGFAEGDLRGWFWAELKK